MHEWPSSVVLHLRPFQPPHSPKERDKSHRVRTVTLETGVELAYTTERCAANIGCVRMEPRSVSIHSVNSDWSGPKNSSLNGLPRVSETSGVAFKADSRSSSESGRIGVGGMANAPPIDHTLSAPGKQRAGRTGTVRGPMSTSCHGGLCPDSRVQVLPTQTAVWGMFSGILKLN